MKNLDKQYTDLLQDILDNGTQKKDRTGTGTLSVFSREIRHKMSDGFPLITTKKMYFKGVVTELIWFLQGRTDLRYLLENDCNIWTGDAYKKYLNKRCRDCNKDNYKENVGDGKIVRPFTKEEFIERIKTDDEFSKKWGDLGPIYGKQWRSWETIGIDVQNTSEDGKYWSGECWNTEPIDQIKNLINDLKTNPDSRRLMVSAWNVGELDEMTLPPCHYGFQCYTRELSESERFNWYSKKIGSNMHHDHIVEEMNQENVPTRALSLKWNQRSVDTPLGLPFNIASYGLLLEILAKEVNMVPDELIGSLGDCHIYLNQIDGVKEQIGQEISIYDRMDWWFKNNKPNRDVCDYVDMLPINSKHVYLDDANVPRRTREPFPLPTLKHMKTDAFYKSLSEEQSLYGHLDNKDFQLENYQSHSTIKLPLSN